MSNSEPIKLEYWYSRDLEQRKNWYSAVAENYNKARPLYPQELIDRVVELTKLTSDSSILEIGCGSGQATRGFAPLGLSMVCLEPSLEASQIAQQNCLAYPKIDIKNTSLEEWKLETGKFDAVLAANAWHWLPPEISYPKSAQALKPEGYLILLWNMSPHPTYEIYQELDKVYQVHAPHLSRYETSQDQKNILKQLGQKIIDSQYFSCLKSEHFLQKVDYRIDDYLLLLQTFSPYLELPGEQRKLLFSDLKATLEQHCRDTIAVSYYSAFHIARVTEGEFVEPLSLSVRDSHIDSYLDRVLRLCPRQTAVTGQFDLTLTGAPTANGSKFYLVILAMLSSLNLLVASPLQFLGRYLSRRSKVGEASPCDF